ncbi:iron-containing alcohol dehydrogenase [Streptomyces sp. 3330]|uniref:iron-containing alcohol dehydrogenase n=1 Tax=Streptomyces sp. 3330 TaxID=2817755 RepID=UPI00286CC9F2|nr:iron-containing alcohol dehydrogenase [Streptomyces sp. 3330]
MNSIWAPRTDPINQALAVEGVRALEVGLPLVMKEPDTLEGRKQTPNGAYLSAMAFAWAGSGLRHKTCHVLGDMFSLPHAQTHAVVLPHVLALHAPFRRVGRTASGRGVRCPWCCRGTTGGAPRRVGCAALPACSWYSAGGCGGRGRRGRRAGWQSEARHARGAGRIGSRNLGRD